jgi:hypothetical protein
LCFSGATGSSSECVLIIILSIFSCISLSINVGLCILLKKKT